MFFLIKKEWYDITNANDNITFSKPIKKGNSQLSGRSTQSL